MTRRSKRTNLIIVAALSLLVIVIASIPWTDEYCALCRAAHEANQLRAQWSERAVANLTIEKTSDAVERDLRKFELQAVDPGNIEKVRDQLIEIVRLSGSRLRHLEVTNHSKRVWGLESDSSRNVSLSNDAEPSRYNLHSHTMEMRSEGSYEMMREMMDLIASQSWMKRLNRFTLTPSSTDRQSVSVELMLTLYGLEERQLTSEDSNVH
jgi:hypothetical protein